jgi:hypothetical protein
MAMPSTSGKWGTGNLEVGMRSRFGSHLLEDDGQNPQNKYSKG